MLKFAHATFDSQTPKAISWTMVKLGVFTQTTSIFEWHKPLDIDGKQSIKNNCKVSASNLSFVLISSIPTPTWLLVFISVYLWSQLTHLYIDIFDYLLFPVISFLPSKWTNSVLITFRHILLFSPTLDSLMTILHTNFSRHFHQPINNVSSEDERFTAISLIRWNVRRQIIILVNSLLS